MFGAIFFLSFQLQQPAPPIVDGFSLRPPASEPMTAEQFTQSVIENMIAAGAPFQQSTPRVHRMGDGAALVIRKILASREFFSPAEQRTIVAILRQAFERPQAILNAPMRRPTETLRLLEQIASATNDPELLRQIDETRTFVQR